MRIVLDTGVLVRANARSKGPARELLTAILNGPHTLISSPFLLAETERVLYYPRLRAAQRAREETVLPQVPDTAIAAVEALRMKQTMQVTLLAESFEIESPVFVLQEDILAPRQNHRKIGGQHLGMLPVAVIAAQSPSPHAR